MSDFQIRAVDPAGRRRRWPQELSPPGCSWQHFVQPRRQGRGIRRLRRAML